MIYSRFYRHNSSYTVFWVSSFHLSVNIVVLYQFTVPGHIVYIENFASKVEAWSLSDGKKAVYDIGRLQNADCRPQIADCKLNDTKNLPNKGDIINNI